MALIDLGLTLKHVHWNVVGPAFIGVHQMLDPQVEAVQGWSTRPRSASPRSAPRRTASPATSSKPRTWDDYAIGRASTQAAPRCARHGLRGVVEGHREAIDKTEAIDPVTQDC